MADRRANIVNVGKAQRADSAEVLPYSQDRPAREGGASESAADELAQGVPEKETRGEKIAENLKRENDQILKGVGKA